MRTLLGCHVSTTVTSACACLNRKTQGIRAGADLLLHTSRLRTIMQVQYLVVHVLLAYSMYCFAPPDLNDNYSTVWPLADTSHARAISTATVSASRLHALARRYLHCRSMRVTVPVSLVSHVHRPHHLSTHPLCGTRWTTSRRRCKTGSHTMTHYPTVHRQHSKCH